MGGDTAARLYTLLESIMHTPRRRSYDLLRCETFLIGLDYVCHNRHIADQAWKYGRSTEGVRNAREAFTNAVIMLFGEVCS